MQFPTPLVKATLVRRYKRFLADVRLADGREVTAHCPNPGAMTGLADPGMAVWLEPNDDPKKKLKFGWRLSVLSEGGLACVDTGVANRVVGEALRAGKVAGLEAYSGVRAEVAYGQGSRVDFLLSGEGQPDLYLEVKSVTLSRQRGLAEFPDTVTKRGARHLGDLAEAVSLGHRAMLLYLVQRDDCDRVGLAEDIDPAYGEASKKARDAGVEVVVMRSEISPQGVFAGSIAGIEF